MLSLSFFDLAQCHVARTFLTKIFLTMYPKVMLVEFFSADLVDVSCPLVDVANASFADCEGKVWK